MKEPSYKTEDKFDLLVSAMGDHVIGYKGTLILIEWNRTGEITAKLPPEIICGHTHPTTYEARDCIRVQTFEAMGNANPDRIISS